MRDCKRQSSAMLLQTVKIKISTLFIFNRLLGFRENHPTLIITAVLMMSVERKVVSEDISWQHEMERHRLLKVFQTLRSSYPVSGSIPSLFDGIDLAVSLVSLITAPADDCECRGSTYRQNAFHLWFQSPWLFCLKQESYMGSEQHEVWSSGDCLDQDHIPKCIEATAM
ncbi:hypothetical protein F2P79_005210 [Pimephales promelas]|nr:hypothetical protein F2P79_005210 [Pimephales promelas]